MGTGSVGTGSVGAGRTARRIFAVAARGRAATSAAMRAGHRRSVLLAVGVLAFSAGVLGVAAPATAAESCFDSITNVTRTASYVGGAGSDGPVGAYDAVISTLGGADTVVAAAGVLRLTVCLGDGHDHFSYSVHQQPPAGASSYSVNGGAGSDRIQGGNGRDALLGESGNDIIVGEGGDDTIMGGDGTDDLHGGPGNDLIASGPGMDFVSGGDGDDQLVGGDATDILDGGPGTDRCVGPGQFINCELT